MNKTRKPKFVMVENTDINKFELSCKELKKQGYSPDGNPRYEEKLDNKAGTFYQRYVLLDDNQ